MNPAATALPPPERRKRQMQSAVFRLQQLISAYLPLLLMALLASGTWWLVKNTPLAEDAKNRPAPRHVPDYLMQNFEIQRIGADGRLKLLISGGSLRHYPDTDTVEIDDARIRAMAPDGGIALIEARRALSNADGSDLQLSGGVLLRRLPPNAADGAAALLEVRGEFIQVLANAEVIRSNLPVTVRQGGTTLQAQAFEYRHLSGQLDLKGRTQGRFESPPPARVKPR